MLVLIDTNVILDILEKRDPFYEASSEILSISETQLRTAGVFFSAF